MAGTIKTDIGTTVACNVNIQVTLCMACGCMSNAVLNSSNVTFPSPSTSNILWVRQVRAQVQAHTCQSIALQKRLASTEACQQNNVHARAGVRRHSMYVPEQFVGQACQLVSLGSLSRLIHMPCRTIRHEYHERVDELPRIVLQSATCKQECDVMATSQQTEHKPRTTHAT